MATNCWPGSWMHWHARFISECRREKKGVKTTHPESTVPFKTSAITCIDFSKQAKPVGGLDGNNVDCSKNKVFQNSSKVRQLPWSHDTHCSAKWGQDSECRMLLIGTDCQRLTSGNKMTWRLFATKSPQFKLINCNEPKFWSQGPF